VPTAPGTLVPGTSGWMLPQPVGEEMYSQGVFLMHLLVWQNIILVSRQNSDSGKEMAMSVRVKRVYETPSKSDGKRILVDRLWPRGLTKEKAGIDIWLKEVAPSTELRKWFGHDPERWGEFVKRYLDELKSNPALDELQNLARHGDVTLVYAARDEQHNEALVLKEILGKLI
jgi:uncharacterized protein YeaO (DUF488 family)